MLVVNWGMANTSKGMRVSLKVLRVRLYEAAIKTPEVMNVVDRNHAPLGMAYKRVQEATDRETSDQDCLPIAVFAFICTVALQCLCSVLFVFGTIPRSEHGTPAPSKVGKERLINTVMSEAEEEKPRRKLAYGLKHKESLKGKEFSVALRKVAYDSTVILCFHSSKA